MSREACIRHYYHLKYFCEYNNTVKLDENLMLRWKKVIEDNHFELVMDCFNVIFGASPTERLNKYYKMGRKSYYTNSALRVPGMAIRKIGRMIHGK